MFSRDALAERFPGASGGMLSTAASLPWIIPERCVAAVESMAHRDDITSVRSHENQ
jgi:hypothetical protein